MDILDINPNDLKETVEIPLDADEVSEAEDVVELRLISMYDEVDAKLIWQRYRRVQLMAAVDELWTLSGGGEDEEVLEEYGVSVENLEALKEQREELRDTYPEPGATMEKMARRVVQELIKKASPEGLQERNELLLKKYKDDGVFQLVWTSWANEQFADLIEDDPEEALEDDSGK